MWQFSAGLGAGVDILVLTATCVRAFYVCFLPFFLDGFIQLCLYHALLKGSSHISAPFPSLGEQRVSPTPLCQLTCHVRYPKRCKISTGENWHEGGSDSHPAYAAFKVSEQKSGGSVPGARFKKLRAVREGRGPQQAAG